MLIYNEPRECPGGANSIIMWLSLSFLFRYFGFDLNSWFPPLYVVAQVGTRWFRLRIILSISHLRISHGHHVPLQLYIMNFPHLDPPLTKAKLCVART